MNAQKIKVVDKKGTINTVNNNTVISATTAPTAPLEGDVWFDTSSSNSIIKIYDADAVPTPIWKNFSNQNIYTQNGTLDGDRDVNGNGKNLRFYGLGSFHIYDVFDVQLNTTGYFQINSLISLSLTSSNISLNGNITANNNFYLKGSFKDFNNLAGTAGQVLSSTGTGTEWIDPNSASIVNKTSNYTLTLADNGKVFTFNSPTDVTLTVPNGLPIGYNISIYQTGDGKVTTQGGATILNRLSRFKTAGKDAGAGLIATGTDIFHLTGDLKN